MGASAAHREKRAEIVRRYRAGEPMDDIAERMGVDPKTVYNVARRAGLPNRHRFDPERTTRILAKYQAGRLIEKIAESEKVHPTFVRHVASRAGLPPRSKWRRRYPLDERAFDHPTPVGWWLVGLIAADGHIGSRDNLVALTQKEGDADVLREFFDYLGCPDRPLTELKLSPAAAARTQSRNRAFAARVQSKKLCDSLANYGITPRKSKTLKFSEEAAAQPAVWLGLLDGDGWISATAQRRRPLLSFFGTPEVMKQCSAFWGTRLSFQRVPAPTVRAHAGGLGWVVLHGANAVRAARILLASSPVSLQRKRRILELIAGQR
jgi:Homeodomain-like domain